MAINYPGPFEVRVNYTTNEPAAIAAHQMRLSCQMSIEGNPGDPFSDWFPEQKGGSNTIPLSTCLETTLNLVKPYFNTAVTFGSAELWEYAPGTFDAVFRSAYVPVAEPTGVPATVSASQTIYTWRTTAGGVMKLTLMGTIISPDVSLTYPTADSGVNAIFAGFLAATSPWLGRDGAYPVAGLKFHPGQNEALWKRLNRN